MKEENGHTARWKVVTLSVSSPGELVIIDEKLAGHIKELKAIQVLIAPSGETLSEIAECGELSLSINNHREHFFHLAPGYTSTLPDSAPQAITLGKSIRENSRLSGYWIDYTSFVNDEQFFVPYKVKIHFECVTEKKEKDG